MDTIPSLVSEPVAVPASNDTVATPAWDALVDPDVRALAALVASPLLVAADAAAIPTLDDDWRMASLTARHDWLRKLDAAPQALRNHLAGSNARQLGRYAEALWQFWFANLPGAHLYAAGLMVKEGSAVRGEFDFIVGLPGLPGVQHLEMGYKFYLHCPPGDGFSRLFGPNPIDRLDRKWQHMLASQLPLSQTPLGRSALPAGADQVVPRACLQGWIFYPLEGKSAAAIPGLSPTHWRGWWCHQNDRRATWSSLAQAWCILPRLHWIASAALRDGADASSSAECAGQLRAHFSRSSQPQLIAGLAPGRDRVWRESVRIFVVPPSWPQTAAGPVHSATSN